MKFNGRGSFWAPLAAVTAAAVAFSLVLAQQRAALAALREREAELVVRLEALKQENVALRDQRDRLLTDAAAIEKVAREQYGFAGPGETATVFAETPPAAAPAPAARDAWDVVLGRGEFPWLLPLGVIMLSAIVFAALNYLSSGHTAGRPD